MLRIFSLLFELKKELILGLSLTIFYITYYLVEVVKVPVVVCGAGSLRALLEREVPLLRERYWPPPWCVEARLQTVLGSLLRDRLLPPLAFRREILLLSDGGQVALEWLECGGGGGGGGGGGPLVVVLPGITGGSHADYVRCIAGAAGALGADLVVVNYRGLGGLPLTTPRLYSAVSHDDFAEVARAVSARAPSRPLLAVGVSLGGLVLGQYLAAAGARAEVAAALLVSAPLDVERGSASLERGANALLSYGVARKLRRVLAQSWPAAAAAPALQRCRSVRQFDAAFTAAHFGFSSAEEYYRAASLHDKLGGVATPTLCLCAADDPFQPRAALARPAAAAARGRQVALAVAARGGHIGFLEGWWPSRAPRDHYVARLAEQYFAALLRHPHLLHTPRPHSPDGDLQHDIS